MPMRMGKATNMIKGPIVPMRKNVKRIMAYIINRAPKPAASLKPDITAATIMRNPIRTAPPMVRQSGEVSLPRFHKAEFNQLNGKAR
jgi:hypothetical protein